MGESIRYTRKTFHETIIPIYFIPHLHDWRKMEVCLINFNKGKGDQGCLKFSNNLKWSATVEGKLYE
jgi:hypothetical protein